MSDGGTGVADGGAVPPVTGVPAVDMVDALARSKVGLGTSLVTTAPNSLGYKQKNPLNLRISGDAWQGKLASSNGFEAFSSFEYGYRAAMKTLKSYRNKGFVTLREIISRWAPPSDGNDTAAYISNVAKWTGFNPDAEIKFTLPNIAVLVWAMSRMETGTTPYWALLEKSWNLM